MELMDRGYIIAVLVNTNITNYEEPEETT